MTIIVQYAKLFSTQKKSKLFRAYSFQNPFKGAVSMKSYRTSKILNGISTIPNKATACAYLRRILRHKSEFVNYKTL